MYIQRHCRPTILAFRHHCTFKRKALSRLIKESRPCAEGFGNARHIRRRDATSNSIASEVASWPAVIPATTTASGKARSKQQACARGMQKNVHGTMTKNCQLRRPTYLPPRAPRKAAPKGAGLAGEVAQYHGRFCFCCAHVLMCGFQYKFPPCPLAI